HWSDFGGIGGKGGDVRVRLFDAATGRETLRLPQEDASALAFAPDGKTLASGASDGTGTLWDLERERRKPTPDPLEIVKAPPADDKLLTGLAADFEELLKKEKDPRPLREAALKFHQTNQNSRWTYYHEALALIRKHRSPAAIPLIL